MSRAKYNEAQWAVLAHPTAVRQYFIGRSPRTSASEFSTAGYRIETNKLPPASEAPAGAPTAPKPPSRERSVCGKPIPTPTNFPLPAKRLQGPQLKMEGTHMNYKSQSYENTARTIIKKFEQRGMTAFYCTDKTSARDQVLSLLEENSSVTWGGSVTLEETGIIDAVKNGPYKAIDRKSAGTPEEARRLYGEIVCSDTFLMSTNAFTLDGELINIDGNGNRVACLITGPRQVIVVTGMNKLVKNVQEGIDRVRTMATPPNAIRVGVSTPCSKTGVCADCTGRECICCQEVITRVSRERGRIKIILVGEELGF